MRDPRKIDYLFPGKENVNMHHDSEGWIFYGFILFLKSR